MFRITSTPIHVFCSRISRKLDIKSRIELARLVDEHYRAQDVAGVELTTSTRMALVELTVELLVLITCWPGSPTPAHPLAYLRARRARMGRYAGWFYAVPRPARRFLPPAG